MSSYYFDPTPQEADKMRKFFDAIPEYVGIKKHFPSFDEALRALPGDPTPKGQKKMKFMLMRINSMLRPIMADALCRVRGLPVGSIPL